MASKLPRADEIKAHYDQVIREATQDYVFRRWGASETQRRHYRQTRTALDRFLSGLATVGDVLEIGCGPAVWTELYIRAATSVLLYDISSEMLEKARLRVAEWDGGALVRKVAYQCGDFVATPPRDRSFDTVLSVRAFEYMADKPAFVRNGVQALRPGGHLAVVTKNRGWRDLARDLRPYQDRPRAEIPIETAMQMDLVGWDDVAAMFRDAGLTRVVARPVVLGSYYRPFTWRPGLWACDLLHRYAYRRPAHRALAFLTESFVVVGSKAS